MYMLYLKEYLTAGRLINVWIFVFFFAVAKLALEKIQPLVRQMDAESHMDKSVLQALFDNGVSLSMWFKQF